MQKIFSRWTFSVRLALNSLAVCAVMFAGISMASAATITVNSFSDVEVNDNTCILREAIKAASTNADYKGCKGVGSYSDNAAGHFDTIVFFSGFPAGAAIITDPQISIIATNVIIDGNYQFGKFIVDGNTDHRVFDITGGTVVLKNLIIQHGKHDFFQGGYGGAGIRMSGSNSNLTLDNCSVINNQDGNSGGGISQQGGTLLIKNSQISNNKVINDIEGGGGIYIEGGKTTINKSIISNNDAASGLVGRGGGIAVAINGGTLTLNHTMVSGNKAIFGGGISTEYESGTIININASSLRNNTAEAGSAVLNDNGNTVTIENTTIDSNTTTANYPTGQALNGESFVIKNSTIVFNKNNQNNQGVFSAGTQLTNSIVAFNKNGNGEIDDCPVSAIVSHGYNLISENFCAGLGADPTSQINVSPAVISSVPLSSPDGVTVYYEIGNNSPALDGGPDLAEAANLNLDHIDQGGVTPRPQGPVFDVGSYEKPSAGVVEIQNLNYTAQENQGTLLVNLVRKGGKLGTLTVKLSTQDVSATAPQDYTASTNKVVTFNNNISLVTVGIPIKNDALPENDETFKLLLSNVSAGGFINDLKKEATVTIPTNDQIIINPGVIVPTVKFNNSGYGISESISNINIPVLRTGNLTGTSSVNYTMTDGTGVAGTNYVSTSGTIDFAPNEISKPLPLQILNDNLAAGNKDFKITLSSPVNANLGTAEATITIFDAGAAVVPPTIEFGVDNYADNEDDAAFANLIEVKRNGDTGSSVDVDYVLNQVSATAGEDYTNVAGTAHFDIGATSTFIDPGVQADPDVENDEVFNILLLNPQGATLGNTTQTAVTIKNDDVAPVATPGSFELDANQYSATEGDMVEVTVLRNGGTDGDTSIDLNSIDGTAKQSFDFEPVQETLQFADGVSSQTIFIPLNSDGEVDPGETFTLELSNPTGGAALGNTTTATVTINEPILAPELTEVAQVVTPTNSPNPTYVFHSTEKGTVTYGPLCPAIVSPVAASLIGEDGNDITLTFGPLTNGTYTGCTVKLTGADTGLDSNLLFVNDFTVNLAGADNGNNNGNNAGPVNNGPGGSDISNNPPVDNGSGGSGGSGGGSGGSSGGSGGSAGSVTPATPDAPFIGGGLDQESPFTDIGTSPYKDAINALWRDCKVDGYKDIEGKLLNLFKPETKISRGELITILMKCRFGVKEKVSKGPFPDVTADNFAAPYITVALENKIVEGYSDGKFRPNQFTSRAEALKMVELTWFKLDVIKKAPAATSAQCVDLKNLWYSPYLDFALANSAVNTYSNKRAPLRITCAPNQDGTRGEIANIVFKIMGLVK